MGVKFGTGNRYYIFNMLLQTLVVLVCCLLVDGRPSENDQSVQKLNEGGEKTKLNFAFLVQDQQYERPADLGEDVATAVSRKSSSYGRKRRSAQAVQLSSSQQQTAAQESALAGGGKRNFGNIASILAIAGAKPVAVELSGSYSGRRKRSETNQQQTSAAQESAPAAGKRNFGNIASILAIAGAKPAAVDPSGSYSGRRKRSENNLHGLVPEVASHAVKIRSRGKHGDLAHEAQDGAVPSRSVFESLKYGRRKRSNPVTFAEYDKERVKTLKIEQNDALALPQRLKAEAQRSERPKRKF